MKKAIVLPNRLKDKDLSLTVRVVKKLLELGIAAYLDMELKTWGIDGAIYYSDLPSDADFMVVIGGDGSVIDASGSAIELDIPLIGVNLGKVGYLATVDPDNIDVLSGLINLEYKIDDKMLLYAEKIADSGEHIYGGRLAVNDVVICHDSYLGISNIRVENESGDHVQYAGDGIIVATPAGSTAYSLSAGGPIISHGLDSITVTPICPHSFFNRSIVYGPNECIKISNLADSPLNVSIDGRLFDRLDRGESCLIRRADRRIKMISFGDTNLFSTLSKKIKLLHDLV